MKKAFMFASLLGVTLMAEAQTTSIKGVFADSITHVGEPYATVRVFKTDNQEHPLAMALTEKDGSFALEAKGSGKCVLVVSALGRKEVRRTLSLGSSATLSVDTLWAVDDAQNLQGVTVEARKPLVKMETDKVSYDVLSDEESKSRTVLDMLRKVPMVTVDGQDNITVNGSSSFKVLVDGKPSPMFSSNPSQVFKSMPATTVKKIEVLTNPGAKYDAEGVGGVLNITLNKQGKGSADLNGYNGNVNVRAGNRQLMGSAFVSGQQGKFSYSAMVFSNRNAPLMVDYSTTRTQQMDGKPYIVDTKVKSDQRPSAYSYANVSMGYDLDSMSVITATMSSSKWFMKSRSDATTSMGFENMSSNAYGTYLEADNNSNNLNVETDYQRFFNKQRTHSLTLSYQYALSDSKSNSHSTYSPIDGYLPEGLSEYRSAGKPRSTEHTAQLDYVLPFSDNHKINAGAKYIARSNHACSGWYDLADGTSTYNETNSSDYKNDQKIMAYYSEYVGNFGKFGAKTGLRFERTWEHIAYKLGQKDAFSRNYNNLVPSASFTYNITQGMNLGVNYGMRIARPGIGYLNPYVDKSQTTQITYGNPQLSVEKSHNIQLVYNMFSAKFSMNVTLGEYFCNNGISQYSFLKDGIQNITYGNVMRSRWTNLNTYLNWAPSTKTRLMANLTGDYGDMRSDVVEARNHGWQASGYVGLDQEMWWKLKLNLGVWATTHHYAPQGIDQGAMQFGFATLTKNFCKDRLTVALSYSGSLRGRFKTKTYTEGKDYITRTMMSANIQSVGVSLTWKFGNVGKQYRQVQSRINNDFMEKSQGSTTSSPMDGKGVER